MSTTLKSTAKKSLKTSTLFSGAAKTAAKPHQLVQTAKKATKNTVENQVKSHTSFKMAPPLPMHLKGPKVKRVDLN